MSTTVFTTTRTEKHGHLISRPPLLSDNDDFPIRRSSQTIQEGTTHAGLGDPHRVNSVDPLVIEGTKT